LTAGQKLSHIKETIQKSKKTIKGGGWAWSSYMKYLETDIGNNRSINKEKNIEKDYKK